MALSIGMLVGRSMFTAGGSLIEVFTTAQNLHDTLQPQVVALIGVCWGILAEQPLWWGTLRMISRRLPRMEIHVACLNSHFGSHRSFIQNTFYYSLFPVPSQRKYTEAQSFPQTAMDRLPLQYPLSPQQDFHSEVGKALEAREQAAVLKYDLHYHPAHFRWLLFRLVINAKRRTHRQHALGSILVVCAQASIWNACFHRRSPDTPLSSVFLASKLTYYPRTPSWHLSVFTPSKPNWTRHMIRTCSRTRRRPWRWPRLWLFAR